MKTAAREVMDQGTGGRRIKVCKMAWLAMAFALLGGALAAGCGGEPSGSGGDKELTLGYVEWEENVAVSNLTKVLMEEQLGYENVELRRAGLREVFEGVSEGELDAFQDVWTPNHEEYLGEVELLDPWFNGMSRSSLAVPDYMNLQSVEQLGSSGAKKIVGPKPEASALGEISRETSLDLPLQQDFSYPSASAMLEEVDRLYEAREPFVFVAWAPHRMNAEYEFEYLIDPEGSLGDLTRPARLSTAVRENLEEEDPVAYVFLDALVLNEHQLNTLETEIREAGDPEAGVKGWLRENEEYAVSWIDAAKKEARR